MKKRRVLVQKVRLWVGEHLGIVLLLVVSAYLVGFFLYHTYAAVDALLWQASVRYSVGDACTLLMDYPAGARLDAADLPGRAVTLWLWSERASADSPSPEACSADLASAGSVSYFVNLGPLGSGLEFTDAEGNLTPARAPITLAPTESSATPTRLFLRRAPSADLQPVALDVWVQAVDATQSSVALPTLAQDGAVPLVRPEPEWASRWRQFLQVLFNPGPLQWMFTAVAGIVGVWEVYKDLQRRRAEEREQAAERRRKQRERIAALHDMSPAERAFWTYQSLRAEFKGDSEILDELRAAFRPEWLPYLRQQLGHQLCVGDWAEAQKVIRDSGWEWRQETGDGALGSVEHLVEHLQRPQVSPSKKVLGQVLDGFRAVGLEATRPVVDWLAVACPDFGLVQEVFFSEGQAGGRYLLRKWGERDPVVTRLLRRWEQEASSPIRYRRGVTGLWARERGESRILRQGVQKLGLDFNPFGPPKAEQDPLLPDLYFRLSPLWEEAIASQSSVLIAPPGTGRTALIWMLRYESGLAGSDVENLFPVFVPLHSLASTEELLQILHKAISDALCPALVRDPYALLGLAEAEQHGLAQFLLNCAGGMGPLLRQLRAAGLNADDPDGRLLQEALSIEARSQEEWQASVAWNLPRFHPYPMKHTLLLIDAALPDQGMVEMLLEAVFQRWLPDMAPRHVVAKVFLPSEPATCPVTPAWFRWDDEALHNLLRLRVERAGLVPHEGRPLLDGWIEGVRDPDGLLVQHAAGNPAQLIRLGNRTIRRIARPEPLVHEEFLKLLSTSRG